MSDDDLRQEVNRLEGQLDAERNRRRELEAQVSQHRESIQELGQALEELVPKIDDLERTYEVLGGVADDAETTAEARERDTLIALERQARDHGDGKWAFDYNDVKDALSTFGHGTVDAKQAYRVIERLRKKIPCCSPGTKNGNKAVRIDLDRADGRPSTDSGVFDAVNNRTTGGGVLTRADGGSTSQNGNKKG